MRRCVIATMSIVIASVASAHPGHGFTTSNAVPTWWHYAVEPVHLIPFLIVLALSIAATRSIARRFAITKQA